MNRVAEKEDRLFEAWASRHESFVRDGIVDADEYARSPVKLLFILKEVNDPGGGGWDLRQFLRDGGRASTWNTVRSGREGIHRLPCIVPWSEVSLRVDQDRRPASAAEDRGRQSEERARRRGGSTSFPPAATGWPASSPVRSYRARSCIRWGARSSFSTGDRRRSRIGVYPLNDKDWIARQTPGVRRSLVDARSPHRAKRR